MEQERKIKIIHQDDEDFPPEKQTNGCFPVLVASIITLITGVIMMSLTPQSLLNSDFWFISVMIVPILVGAISILALYNELDFENISETLWLILKQMFLIILMLLGWVLLGVGALFGFCLMK